MEAKASREITWKIINTKNLYSEQMFTQKLQLGNKDSKQKTDTLSCLGDLEENLK